MSQDGDALSTSGAQAHAMFRSAAVALAVLAGIDLLVFDGAYLHALGALGHMIRVVVH